MQEPEILVEGPLVDQETGMRSYVVRSESGQASFGVVPLEEGGTTRWIMRPGPDMARPTDPGFEPYWSEQEAYEAGIRASRISLGG